MLLEIPLTEKLEQHVLNAVQQNPHKTEGSANEGSHDCCAEASSPAQNRTALRCWAQLSPVVKELPHFFIA